jgi:hypothetical protein
VKRCGDVSNDLDCRSHATTSACSSNVTDVRTLFAAARRQQQHVAAWVGPELGPRTFQRRKSFEQQHFRKVVPAWAQGVAGSNSVAPTTSLENLYNTNNDRELAESSATLAICRASPSIAVFHLRVGPKVGPPKSQLSDANDGGCWNPAANGGHTRRRTAASSTGGRHARA